MRWCASFGIMLAAAAMIGGDVAGNAAPNASMQRSETAADPARTVDVELVLAVDISYSMDVDELALQREGYAQAIASNEFMQALKAARPAASR